MLTTQLYLKVSPSRSSSATVARLSSFLEEINAWMSQNFLQLNGSKTEAIQTVTNLGVKFDTHLSLDNHVTHICKTFFHLRSISKLHPFLSLPAAEKLVHAFISSNLDYYNTLIGIPGKSLQKLQNVQNSTARVLTRVRKYEYITPIILWLPVTAQIEYKILLHTHHYLLVNAPTYFTNLTPHTSARTRSGQQHCLLATKTRLKTMGDKAANPRPWNTLPHHVRAPQMVDALKKKKKKG
ncbi:uncharacterized protein LOC133560533 [Nerophis ophidion]|uniref:uncharacterized protein LOC133560533 n=1 Tax=Nerophis ophidion TaxID=159077 RepID=UPI002ADF9AC2|nr:uncharacterized protein LOC133560533 [Nerophis ophidion]